MIFGLIHEQLSINAPLRVILPVMLLMNLHLLCFHFLQGLTSKEAELLKDGFNADKTCGCDKQSPLITDMAMSMDPPASEPDTPNSSNAPTPYAFESQLKLEADNVPSTSGTAKNCVFKLGMFASFLHLRRLNLSQRLMFFIYNPSGDRVKYSSPSGGIYQLQSISARYRFVLNCFQNWFLFPMIQLLCLSFCFYHINYRT